MTSRRRLLALLPALLLVALAGPVLAQTPAPSPGAPGDGSAKVIDIVQIKGDLDAAYADYLVEELHAAARKHYTAVVLRLDSRGTIKTSAERLIRAVRTSPVPVAAWVGPNDARIAGAATALWSAAAVRFVGPGAEVRSTNPFDVGGAVDKVLAAEGGLVDPALTLRGSEAVDRGFAQSVKSTLFEVVKGLDGQVVNGVPLRIDPAGKDTAIRFANPDLLKRIRHTLATPWLAYLLLLVGAAALVFELFQPGFGPAGWSGLLGIALALVGLIALPTNWPMFALLAVGMTAMTYDVARGGLGALTWGGVALFGVGSWFLVHSHGSALRVPMWAVITGVLLALLYWVVIMTVVLRALRGPSADAGAALVGQTAEVRSTLNPQGHVLVDGALWRARVASDTDPVPAGTKVLVTGLDADALVLDVEQVSEPATASGSHS